MKNLLKWYRVESTEYRKLYECSTLHSRPYTLSRSFTIVETLVAITILMIAVAGPLVVASKGLTSALVSKNQMIASYLAQDTMEMLKNIRDNTLQEMVNEGRDSTYINANWLNDTGYIAGNQCDIDSRGCDMNGVDGPSSREECNGTPCVIPIYYKDSSGYTHSSTGGAKQTIFSRHFYFSNPVINNNKPEVTAHVIVDWKEGKIPYQIELMSQMIGVSK